MVTYNQAMDITASLFTLYLLAMDLHTGMDNPLAMGLGLDMALVMEMDMVLGTVLDMVTDLFMGMDLHLRVTMARDHTLFWILKEMSQNK